MGMIDHETAMKLRFTVYSMAVLIYVDTTLPHEARRLMARGFERFMFPLIDELEGVNEIRISQ